MGVTVKQWSGKEVRALREARRMSIREFAAHLGVSDRMVSKWESGGERIRPRPINQAALDTSLLRTGPEIQARFAQFVSPEILTESVSADDPSAICLRHGRDGKLMTLVSGGVFLSGADDQPAWQESFWIDVYPTTNADYMRYVRATNFQPPEHWNADKPPREIANHPVVFVSWEDASSYAEWAGKTMPTAQQWEKAARGTSGGVYPWGDQPTPAKCNVRGSGPGSTTPVDRYHSGVSQYGVYDLCGNVWEWCSTRTTANRYELKGSAFTSPFDRVKPSSFNDADASMRDDDTGFRCAATDPPNWALASPDDDS